MISIALLPKTNNDGNGTIVKYSSSVTGTYTGGYSGGGGSIPISGDSVRIWGQRFNGSNDISGDLTVSGSILDIVNATGTGVLRFPMIYQNGNPILDNNNSGIGIGWVKVFNNTKYFLSTNQSGEVDHDTVFTKNLTVQSPGALYAGRAIIDNGSIHNLDASNITTDNLTVTKAAHFFTLIIDEVKSVGGQLIISPANATIDLVETVNVGSIDYYRCYFRAEDGEKKISQTFAVNDQVVCETFNAAEGTSYNVSNKYYWRKCCHVSSSTVVKNIKGKDYDCHWIDLAMDNTISKGMDPASNAIPEEGDAIAMLGNQSDTTRQAAIIISAYTSQFLDPTVIAPSIVQYDGINGYSLKEHRLNEIKKNGNIFRGSFLAGDTDLGDAYNALKQLESGESIMTYVHWAWANSADGSQDFTKTNNGQAYKYIGVCSNYTESDSNLTYSSYKWTYIQGAKGDPGAPGTPGAAGKDGSSFNIKGNCDDHLTQRTNSTQTQLNANGNFAVGKVILFDNSRYNSTGFTTPSVGTITSTTNWPTGVDLVEATVGDCYIQNSNGHLWVNTGTEWKDVGALKGEKGEDGPSGQDGQDGENAVQYILVPLEETAIIGTAIDNTTSGFSTKRSHIAALRYNLYKVDGTSTTKVQFPSTPTITPSNGSQVDMTLRDNRQEATYSFSREYSDDTNIPDWYTINVWASSTHNDANNLVQRVVPVTFGKETLRGIDTELQIIWQRVQNTTDGQINDLLAWKDLLDSSLGGVHGIANKFTELRQDLNSISSTVSTNTKWINDNTGTVNWVTNNRSKILQTDSSIFTKVQSDLKKLGDNSFDATKYSTTEQTAEMINNEVNYFTNRDPNMITSLTNANEDPVVEPSAPATTNPYNGNYNLFSNRMTLSPGKYCFSYFDTQGLNPDIYLLKATYSSWSLATVISQGTRVNAWSNTKDNSKKWHETGLSIKIFNITSSGEYYLVLSSSTSRNPLLERPKFEAGETPSDFSFAYGTQIEQTARKISLSVFDTNNGYVSEEDFNKYKGDVSTAISDGRQDIAEKIRRTGIDIESGKITLDAANTTVTGDLVLESNGTTSQSRRGFIVYNDNKTKSVEVRNDELGYLDYYNIGGSKYITDSKTQSKGTTSSTSPFNVTFDINIGQFYQNSLINIDNVYFTITSTNGYVSELSDSLSSFNCEVQLRYDNTYVSLMNARNLPLYSSSSLTRSYLGLPIDYNLSKTAPATANYTVRFIVKAYTKGNANLATSVTTRMFATISSAMESVIKLGLDGAVFAQSARQYFWMGKMKAGGSVLENQHAIVMREKNHAIRVNPYGVWRTIGYTGWGDIDFSDLNNRDEKWSDISTTVPAKILSSSYSATLADGFLIVTGNGNINITLPAPSTCPGKIYYIKKIKKGNTNANVTVKASGSTSSNKLFYGESNDEAYEYISAGSKMLMFIASDSYWCIGRLHED